MRIIAYDINNRELTETELETSTDTIIVDPYELYLNALENLGDSKEVEHLIKSFRELHIDVERYLYK